MGKVHLMVVSLTPWSSCWGFSTKAVPSAGGAAQKDEREYLLLIFTKPPKVSFVYAMSKEEKLSNASKVGDALPDMSGARGHSSLEAHCVLM